MTNSEKLIAAAKDELDWDETLNEALKEYVEKISDAINPISDITAPVIAAALMLYADGILRVCPDARDTAEKLVEIIECDMAVERTPCTKENQNGGQH